MARKKGTDQIRTCPLCQHPVEPGELGLRDYAWLSDALPGRNGATDFDAVFTQNRTGRSLILEFKPGAAPLPMGQRLALQLFVLMGSDVWVAWDSDPQAIRVHKMDQNGQLSSVRVVTKDQFSGMLSEWWAKGLK